MISDTCILALLLPYFKFRHICYILHNSNGTISLLMRSLSFTDLCGRLKPNPTVFLSIVGSTVKPLNSGHLRVLKDLPVIEVSAIGR